jgi:hypothetical protein
MMLRARHIVSIEVGDNHVALFNTLARSPALRDALALIK